ncbi:MAG: hypothetical protein JW874_11400 [Spirochaetales bacterium]|nr:hypothetical protein [Spirochaetales bacterium]
MMKKLLCLLIFLAAFIAVWAQEETEPVVEDTEPVAEETEVPAAPEPGDQKLNVYQKVDGTENWRYYYDLSGYKKGKYNIIIKGVDKSGNIFYKGPLNIYIDPQSDIPVTHISNPSSRMRVGGKNLNIVGTCIDDDAVAFVEVMIDDGDFRKAEGQEFWSWYLDTTVLTDGPHTISARGTDINGKVGEPVSTVFNLDTANPINTISSHPNGVLITGKVTMEGQVNDLNGVKSLALSTDEGKTFEPLKVSYNKGDNIYEFKLSINTEKMEDGPHVYWFRSKDNTGSIGNSAFLFFVDNTDPQITVISPAEEETVNGKFSVCGKTSDEIGITSFTYEFEGESGEIPLIPGNPYWVHEFDVSNVKGKTADITFIAEDVTGNKTDITVKLPIDREADMAVTTLVRPENGALISGDVLLSGFAADDDGVKELSYSLDGAEAVTKESGNAFNFKIEDVAPGKHTLAVTAIDINGNAGKEAEIEFVKTGEQATIRINNLRQNNEDAAFAPGIEVLRDKGPVLVGEVRAQDKIEKAVYRFRDNEYVNLPLKGGQEGIQNFEINAAKETGPGVNTLDIQITDIHNRVSEFRSFIYIRNYSRINLGPGLYFSEAVKDSKRINISAEDPFSCVFVGDAIKTAELVPDTPNARLKREQNIIKIVPGQSGASEKVRIRVTTVYDEVFESDEFVFTGGSAAEGPSGRLTRAAGNGWESAWANGIMVPLDIGKIQLEGICSADVKEGELVFPNSAVRKLAVKGDKNATEKSFSGELPADLPYGRVDVVVKLRDANKIETEYKVFFFKTAQVDPSTVVDDEIIYFADTAIKGNTVTLAQAAVLAGYFNGRKIRDAVLEPASDFLELTHRDRTFQIRAAKAGTSEATKIKITTVNGREFESPAFRFISDSEAPRMQLDSPKTGSWVKDSITVSGTAGDNLGLAKLEYSFDNGATFKPVPYETGDNGIQFSTSLSSGSADGNVAMIFRATDVTGNTTEQLVNIMRDTKPAVVRLLTPQPEDTVNGKITVVGKAKDAGSVAWVEFGDSATKAAGGSETAGVEGTAAASAFRKIDGTNIFHFDLDFSAYETLPSEFIIQAHDMSDNISRFIPSFKVDTEIDKPVVNIQVPENMAVLKNDFVISGMAFDDDGVKNIYYQLDDNAAVTINGSNNFEIPVKLDTISDNEHTIKVWAEDLGGVQGDQEESVFVISKAEPVSVLAAPSIDTTVKGKITFSGTSSDDNGIKDVYLSFDNANTYNLASGAEEWSYSLDTGIVADGTYSLYIKAVDKTDTEGISATIVNIDNTPPKINLDLPADGDTISGKLLFDGRAFDNIALRELKAIMTPLPAAPAAMGAEAVESEVSAAAANGKGRTFVLPTDGIFSERADLKGLEPGWYNVRLEAKDNADNVCYLSRNIQVRETVVADTVDIIFPVDGSSLNGYFTLSGRVESVSKIENVVIYLDDKPAKVVDINESGYYSLDFGTGTNEEEVTLADGPHSLRAEARLDGDVAITSDVRTINYRKKGGYITITSMEVGTSVTDRPWIRGTAGYYLEAVDKSEGDLFKEYQAELKENRIERVEISMDNGRTYKKVKGTEKWKFRLETGEIPDGELPIIVRAMFNDQVAVTKTILFVDDTPPEVKLLSLEEGQRVNEELMILGTAQDENGLDEVFINLRKGDKAGYSVPSFIQGMYLDGHILGSTDWEAGFGLTFFDQVVKLQANIGHAPYQREGYANHERFYGTSLSVKILANIAQLPFGTLFKNHDLDLMSMNFAVGASFTYFSMVEEGFGLYNPDVPYVIIGALLAQIEFPKIKIENMKMFNTYSTYMEASASFISADVQPEIKINLSFGIRIGLL